ncbi:MAG: argininosuccinate lyase [Betaproteobacteria bacterium]|nr:argininosuccinate lyase [Betaproteobacteria bacterium]
MTASRMHSAAMRVLEIGARLNEAPSDLLVRSAFARDLAVQIGLHEAMSLADIAHTLELSERGLIPVDAGRELLNALLALHEESGMFNASPERGDLYSNRETWLSERTPATGWLGLGRARREPVTTAFHLKSLATCVELVDALADSVQALTEVAAIHGHSVMPEYTYLQAAQPTTFGHYLLSFADPLLRSLSRARELHDRFNQCPAGIGASNGAPVPQQRAALATHLGFARPVRHCRDAMWLADLPIEALGVAVTVAVTLDRLAEDLMILATAEFGYVRFADRHSRASKVMPQKRNPFALAYVRAEANRLLGVQAALVAAARTPTGSMDNRLDAYAAVPDALTTAGTTARMVAEILRSMEFDLDRAGAALAGREVCAADLAVRLSLECRVDYRSAHRAVGRLVRDLDARDESLAKASPADLVAALEEAGRLSLAQAASLLRAALDLDACIEARSDLGGAAPREVSRMAEESHALAGAHRRWAEERGAAMQGARAALLAAARRFVAGAA